jgi:glycosyltransferase involved in cell wall biosynthesis
MTKRVVYLDHTAVLSGGELALQRTIPHVSSDAHVILASDGPLAPMLRARGISVEILAMGAKATALTRQQVTLHRLQAAVVWEALLYTWRLSRRLRTLRADLVHTNSLKSALYGGVAAKLAGVPVVWHLRDRIAPDYLPTQTVFAVRLLSRLIPTAVIANSRTTLNTLPRSRRRRDRDAVIPSPVALAGTPRDRSRDGDSLVIGMVGRLAPWKGQDVFLRAFADAFAGTTVKARVVGGALFGEDSYARSLSDLAEALGVSTQVSFSGFLTDVEAEYAGMDILVHASVTPEPFGQVVVEGMAAGLAVIASAAGGPLEVIEPGIDGLLVDPGDVSALAAAMQRLVRDRSLRTRLQRQGPISAARYRPEIVGQQIDVVHGAVLDAWTTRGLRARLGH